MSRLPRPSEPPGPVARAWPPWAPVKCVWVAGSCPPAWGQRLGWGGDFGGAQTADPREAGGPGARGSQGLLRPPELRGGEPPGLASGSQRPWPPRHETRSHALDTPTKCSLVISVFPPPAGSSSVTSAALRVKSIPAQALSARSPWSQTSCCCLCFPAGPLPPPPRPPHAPPNPLVPWLPLSWERQL